MSLKTKTIKLRKTFSRTEDLVKTSGSGFPSVCGLILCAGSGSRAGLPYNKLLHYVGKKTVLEVTLDRFAASCCKSVMLAVSKDDYDIMRGIAAEYSGVTLCLGGETRSESVRRGLYEIGCCDVVVIHDGARPYVTSALIDQTVQSALKHGSGVLAVPAVDTIKEVSNDTVIRSFCRAGLFHIQTPQAFNFNQITEAYRAVREDCYDDSEVYQRAGFTPRIVLGDYANIKLTTPDDFLRPAGARCQIGVGFDVHRLVAGRPLVLGGITVPFTKGLDGHSDADVLTHAVMDALLSAAGLPDIGVLFPDTDPKFKGAESVRLLAEVRGLINRRGYGIGNVSAVVMAERPKLASFIPDICASLARVLQIEPQRINVSATTAEGLGIVGEGKGMAASATCLLSY